MLRRIAFTTLCSLVTTLACSSSGGPTGNGDDNDDPALTLLAAFLTEHAAELSATPQHRPNRLGPPTAAMQQAVIASQGADRMVVFTVAPAALARDPRVFRAEDLTFVISPPAARAPGLVPAGRQLAAAEDVNDPQIQASIQKILDKMVELGLPTTNLQAALDDTEVHEEGAQAGGVMVPSGASAVSFPLDFNEQFHLFGFPLVWVYDGHSHMVLKPRDAQDLRDGKIIENDRLTTAAANALHELIHIMLEQQDLEGIDDSEDTVVANLEHALVGKINAELGRAATGTPNTLGLGDYSLFVGMVVAAGGEAGLQALGLPGGAQNLQVTAPAQVAAGGTFTMTFTVQKTDGTPLANEDVLIHVAGEAANGGMKVVRTDATGAGSLSVTALPTAGEIRLNTSVLGQSVRKNVEIVAGAGTRVSVAPPTGRIRVHGTARLNATVENNANTAVRWSSSNEAVATVGSDGTVTGVSPGSATITATSEADPTATGTATIEVISLSGIYQGDVFTTGGFLAHDPFVFNAGPAPGRADGVAVFVLNPTMITVGGLTGGPSNLPLLIGPLQPDGTFTVFGRGTIAGFPAVGIAGSGQISSTAVLTLDLRVGTEGELPGGQEIDYRFLGMR